jgi:hypothetical protein
MGGGTKALFAVGFVDGDFAVAGVVAVDVLA